MVAQPVISCTPMRDGTPWHMQRGDFEDITANVANAAALRVCENKANRLINELRRKHNIPLDHLPHQDDLWFPLTAAELAQETRNVRRRTTYERVLAEQTRESEPPSLIELGFVKKRYIARPGEDAVRPKTTIYRDYGGKFIVVDREGYYVDNEGIRHDAANEGWYVTEAQYYYDSDAVNAATAAAAFEDPPAPPPRWKPMIKKNGIVSNEPPSPSTDNAASLSTPLPPAPQGGTLGHADDIDPHNVHGTMNNSVSSTESHHNITIFPSVTRNSVLYRDTVDFATVQHAQCTTETLIALASSLLDIPAREACDEETWRTMVEEPAQWIAAKLQLHAPYRIWEILHRHIAGMKPGGPTWYAQNRVNATLTLRHIVGPADPSKPLSGYNWTVAEEQMDKENTWWPDALSTPYDGPRVVVDELATNYEGGYTGEAAPPTTEEPAPGPAPVIELPVQDGMTCDDAETLTADLLAEYPTLSIGYVGIEQPGRVYVLIERAPDKWLYLRRFDVWYSAPPALRRLVALAAEFGATLISPGDDGGGGETAPPGLAMESEVRP